MEEPLLGHSQRRFFSFQSNLKLSENNNNNNNNNVGDSTTLVIDDDEEGPFTVSEFKEKLVYGSLESPAGYYLSRLFSNNVEQSETEDFLSEGGGRRVHPVSNDKQWMLPRNAIPESPGRRPAERKPSFRNEPPTRKPSFIDEPPTRKPSFINEQAMSRTSSSSSSENTDSHSFMSDCTMKKKKYLKKSRTAPTLNLNFHRRGHDQKKKMKRPELGSSSSVVIQASLGLLIYLAIGVGIYVWRINDFSGQHTNSIVDAIYFCIVTMCTVGYGDITPLTPSAKIFACVFVLVGFGFIDVLLSGMVAYVLERQEHLLLSAVEGSHHDTAKNYVVNTEKGRMRIRMKVGLALAVVVFCLVIGTLFMHWTEKLGWLDSFYLSCMSVTTVGYGDHTFKTLKGRLFAAGWLLVSTLAVARSFLFLAEARIDKRNRLIAKWVLNREMTVADLVAADVDNHGFVTKSEYVIYKLKEMGRLSEKDIADVCKQFNILDKDNCGRITISCLVNDEPSP